MDLSERIEVLTAHRRTAFGSVRVEATIGATTWATSLFPDSASGAYLLPVRQGVRRAEGIGAGETRRVGVRIVGG